MNATISYSTATKRAVEIWHEATDRQIESGTGPRGGTTNRSLVYIVTRSDNQIARLQLTAYRGKYKGRSHLSVIHDYQSPQS